MSFIVQGAVQLFGELPETSRVTFTPCFSDENAAEPGRTTTGAGAGATGSSGMTYSFGAASLKFSALYFSSSLFSSTKTGVSVFLPWIIETTASRAFFMPAAVPLKSVAPASVFLLPST